MNASRRLGLLGGTFDPIHVGHLVAAEAVARVLKLDEVWLLTSHVPPHRPQPVASVHHRFAMVALGVQDHPAMRASDLELLSPGPSYTSTTLARLHAAGYRPSQLFFIVGADAFAEIATWKDYPGFLDATNFAIVNRGERSIESEVLQSSSVAARVRTADAADPGSGGATAVFVIDGATPDVSSTAIRACRGRGESIRGMVPLPVERHIERHALYMSGDASAEARIGHLTSSLLHEQEHT